MQSLKTENVIDVVKTRAKMLQNLEKARAAKGPLPPFQAGIVRKKKALLWVYRWGWSTPTTIELLMGSQRSGLAARLIKADLLKSTKTESGTPPAFLTLTEQGKMEVEKYLDDEEDLIDYQLDPYRIDQSKIRHGLVAQNATANNLKNGFIVEYMTEQMAAAKSAKNVKQHDVTWIKQNGEKIGIEVELSAKWARKLDEFVLSCIRSIQSKRVNSIFIATDSKSINKRYGESFKVGKKFGQWEKSQLGFYKQIGEYKVPDFMDGKVSCLLVD
jgi:hypothetical protein